MPHDSFVGKKFGKLLVLQDGGRAYDVKQQMWLCRCECGVEKPVSEASLREKKSRSCGCAVRKGRREAGYKHPLYRLWRRTTYKCHHPEAIGYAYYGGRGITVCDEWRESFDAFKDYIESLGLRPPNYSLDRIDVNKGYEPGNVRWANSTTQARNRTSNTLLELNGEIHPIEEWGDRLGISSNTISHRLNKSGWSIHKALTTPKRNYNKQPNKQVAMTDNVFRFYRSRKLIAPILLFQDGTGY